MTLVLTHVSERGVAMAADSAISDKRGRALVGVQKLLPAYLVGAGLALWGHGHVNGTLADEWLARFIASEISEGMQLWQVAHRLADGLNDGFGRVIDHRMGVHVGGFDEAEGIRGPAFYHVHNGHYSLELRAGDVIEVPGEDPPIREFRGHPDHPLVRKGADRYIRNGDFSTFSLLFDRLHPMLAGLKAMTGLSFPYPEGLATQGEYLRFWIHATKEVYRLSNARPRILPQPATAGDASIGGPITVLTISDCGIESFYTR
jgi:hypothetical protein